MGLLDDRRALVTGAASGIGRATALRLAAEGAAVVVNDVRRGDQAEEVVAAIERDGGRAVALQADVSDEAQVVEMFSLAREELGGRLDLLVNNAGVAAPYALEDMQLEEWQRVLSVNLTGPFLCSREFVRAEPPRGATIVMVSSVHELIPWRSFSHYCASKGGLKLFGQTIARELAPRGIRVVMVAPGAILTPINQELVEDPEKRREQEGQIPWGRLGEPDEVARAIAWIASQDAEYVTGTTLFVDGGMTLYPNFK
jgi:glucose 1-dehydrogenase